MSGFTWVIWYLPSVNESPRESVSLEACMTASCVWTYALAVRRGFI